MVRVATIDNFQGEEADIIIASLVRSNPAGDVGFMAEPERVNVLFSRARFGMIVIGSLSTFKLCRKPSGRAMWSRMVSLLGERIVSGLPILCATHGSQALIRQPEDFGTMAPDGGCALPCEALAPGCGHPCPRRCHHHDYHTDAKPKCTFEVEVRCEARHLVKRECSSAGPMECATCKKLAKIKAKAAKSEAVLQAKREQAEIDRAKIEVERTLAEKRREAAELCLVKTQLRGEAELAVRKHEIAAEMLEKLSVLQQEGDAAELDFATREAQARADAVIKAKKAKLPPPHGAEAGPAAKPAPSPATPGAPQPPVPGAIVPAAAHEDGVAIRASPPPAPSRPAASPPLRPPPPPPSGTLPAPDPPRIPSDVPSTPLRNRLPFNATIQRRDLLLDKKAFARGAFSKVYKAQFHGSAVVAKVFNTDGCKPGDLRAKVAAEAELQERCSHTNVAYSYGLCADFEDEDEPFVALVMEEYRGNLSGLLESRGAAISDGREAARLLAGVAWGLDHLHRNGVVHKDLKMDNILLRGGGGAVDVSLEAVVADFGLAVDLSSTSAQYNLTGGTFAFQAPEQLRPYDAHGSRLRVTPAVDIYALGVIAWCLATNQVPWEGETITGVIQQVTELGSHLEFPPVPADPAWAEIKTLALRCFARDPSQRPTASDAASVLNKI
jgi:tRNA A-37 threonylcarbamoyl transferase component Bud32